MYRSGDRCEIREKWIENYVSAQTKETAKTETEIVKAMAGEVAPLRVKHHLARMVEYREVRSGVNENGEIVYYGKRSLSV